MAKAIRSQDQAASACVLASKLQSPDSRFSSAWLPAKCRQLHNEMAEKKRCRVFTFRCADGRRLCGVYTCMCVLVQAIAYR